jgi:hypothetical protein
MWRDVNEPQDDRENRAHLVKAIHGGGTDRKFVRHIPVGITYI